MNNKTWYIHIFLKNENCEGYIVSFKGDCFKMEYETICDYVEDYKNKIAFYTEKEAIRIRDLLNICCKGKRYLWEIDHIPVPIKKSELAHPPKINTVPLNDNLDEKKNKPKRPKSLFTREDVEKKLLYTDKNAKILANIIRELNEKIDSLEKENATLKKMNYNKNLCDTIINETKRITNKELYIEKLYKSLKEANISDMAYWITHHQMYINGELIQDQNMVELWLSQESEGDNIQPVMKPLQESSYEMFKKLGFSCNHVVAIGNTKEKDHCLYTYKNDPINDKYIKIYYDGGFFCNEVIKPSEHKAIIKKLEEIKNEENRI